MFQESMIATSQRTIKFGANLRLKVVLVALVGLFALVHTAATMKFIRGFLMGAYMAKHHNPVHPINVVMVKQHG